MNLDFSISLNDITPENREAKLLKAVRAISEQLGIPVSIADRKKHEHGPHKGEAFLYKSHEQLIYKWYNFFSEAVSDAYNFVVAYFGLPEIRVVSKAADVLKYNGKIIYSPETGLPIKQSDWDSFVKLLDRFLNRRLDGADRIVLDGKTLGRVLGRMLKYNKWQEVRGMELQDIRYHNKTFDWIADSVKNMRNTMGEELSRGEMARIQVFRQSAAQKVTKVSDSIKGDIKQILIDGVKSRKGKSQISQDLFDRMTGHNRDFQKIADTEIENAINNSFLQDEVHYSEPGEKVYFQRVEVIDGNTCDFCKKMHGVIVLWSDHPLPDDRIKDPIAKFAIWDGKDWDGKKEFVANGAFHPYCRGVWMRYWDKAVDALVAHTQNETELHNRAVDQARAEYKKRGIPYPHDKTPGFTERIRQLYKEHGPEPGKEYQDKYADAFNLARMEFYERGITHPTGKTPGFLDRVQDLYQELMGKSLTWSGHELEDRYKFAGFNISVENKKGSTRCGKDKDGHDWECKLYFDYGYIRGTEGVDGDHVDVYIGPNEDAHSVYIVHQNDPTTGNYDEDKVMLGFSSLHDARTAYLKQYDRPGFLGKVDVMPIGEFREKVLSKKYHGKMVKSFSDRVKETMGGRS
jgi:hypothetical protein